MKPKALKLWNGRGYIVCGAKWHPKGEPHIYIAAYSRADAVRLIGECLGSEPRSADSELRNYFSEGCWGNPMDGITPERGIWMTRDQDRVPKRLI